MANFHLILCSILYLVINVILFDWFILFRSNSIFHKFFYRQIKHILSKDSNPNYKLIHSINIAFYLFYIIRFLYIIRFMMLSKSIPTENLDFFIHFFNQFSQGKDYFYIVTFIMLFLFNLLLEPLVYFTPINTITWKKYHNLNVVNFELYERYSENYFEFNKQFLSKRMISILTLKSAEINCMILSISKLAYFPTISTELRVTFIKATIIMNKICKLIAIISCKSIS